MKKLTLAFAAILAASCATAASAAMYTDFDSYASFEEGGNPVFAFDDAGDYWAGEWNGGGFTADTVTVEIAEGAGFNGTKALKVQSSGHENVGLYLFATEKNGIATNYTGAQYLRAWMDFSEVEFRKANFGVADSTYSLFTTDEVDGAWECKYYYSADGVNWEEYLHGDDGCFGTGQAGTVLGLKGWFAFPVADFTIRSSANWEAYDDKTPANPADVSGVYLFWDYDDATAAETPFYIDNLEFVADYKAFDYDAGAGAAASTEAPAAEATTETPAAAPAAGEWSWVIDENYIVLSDWADVDQAFGDAYPASLDWEWPEVTSGTLLKGTIVAGFNGSSHCWSNGSDTAANAFDGDPDTFFDPFAATTESWAGLLLDQPYELTEIRIHPRSTFTSRLPGAAIQGSNDGVNWTDILFIDKAATGLTDAPNGVDYHCFTPATNDTYVAANSDLGAAEPDFSVYWVGSGAYQAYRYVNINGDHGDVGEIELYGVPAAASSAPAATEAPAAEEAPAAAPAEGEFEYAHYVASANDPYFAYENTIDIDPEVVTWAQIKYRTITEKDSLDNTLTGQIYITPAAEPNIPVKWNHTGNWETIVVDLTSVSETTSLTSIWKDSLGLGFRLDPMESNRDAEANTGNDPASVLPDSAIDIAYVAFFETEEAAKAFDGVNGAVALVDAAMLAAPSASTNGAVELLTETPAAAEEAPVVEEEPVAEETPAEEPAAEETVEEVPAEEEAPAEEVVEEEVVEEAPETFDFGVIAAVAAVIAAAGFAISKKR